MQSGETMSDIVDIVSFTKSHDLTSFLEAWKPYHMILIQEGDPYKKIKIPSWVDYELYNWIYIEKSLGYNSSWIIPHGESSISFGFLVSDRLIVYCLDENTLPLRNPFCELIDVIVVHVLNLVHKSKFLI